MGKVHSRQSHDDDQCGRLPLLSLAELPAGSIIYTNDKVMFLSDKIRKFLPKSRHPKYRGQRPLPKADLLTAQQLREILIDKYSYNDEVRNLIIELQTSPICYRPTAGSAIYLFMSGPVSDLSQITAIPYPTAILLQCSTARQYLSTVMQSSVITTQPIMFRGFINDGQADQVLIRLMDRMVTKWQWNSQHNITMIWSPNRTATETRRAVVEALKDIYDEVMTPVSSSSYGIANGQGDGNVTPRQWNYIGDVSTASSDTFCDEDFDLAVGSQRLGKIHEVDMDEEPPKLAKAIFDKRIVINAMITFSNVVVGHDTVHDAVHRQHDA